MLHVSFTLFQTLSLLLFNHLLCFFKPFLGTLFLSKLNLVDSLLNNNLLLVQDIDVIDDTLLLLILRFLGFCYFKQISFYLIYFGKFFLKSLSFIFLLHKNLFLFVLEVNLLSNELLHLHLVNFLDFFGLLESILSLLLFFLLKFFSLVLLFLKSTLNFTFFFLNFHDKLFSLKSFFFLFIQLFLLLLKCFFLFFE